MRWGVKMSPWADRVGGGGESHEGQGSRPVSCVGGGQAAWAAGGWSVLRGKESCEMPAGLLRKVTGGTLLFTLLGSWGRCLRGGGCTAWTYVTLSGGTPRADQRDCHKPVSGGCPQLGPGNPSSRLRVD